MKLLTGLLLLILSIHTIAPNATIHVTNESSQDCPRESKCISTFELLANISFFVKSNTFLQFDSGLHLVNYPFGNLLIRDLQNLTIQGAVSYDHKPATTIVCTQPVALTFANVAGLTIQNIQYLRCGAPLTTNIIQLVNQLYATCQGQGGIHLPPCDPAIIVESTMTAIYHSNGIKIENIGAQNTDGVALIAVGIYGQLAVDKLNLTSNRVNFIVATLPSASFNNHYLLPEKYTIKNSLFERGNTSDSRVSSGLNLIIIDLDLYQLQVSMNNIMCRNNVGMQGNFLVELNICHEGDIQFNVANFESTYRGNKTGAKHHAFPGIIIKPSSYLRLFTNRDVGVIQFILEDSKLNNSGVIIRTSMADEMNQQHANINTHLKSLTVCCIQETVSVVIYSSDVTLTDFKLLNASLLAIFDSNLEITGQSLFKHNNVAFTAMNSTVHFTGNTTITENFNRVNSISSIITFTNSNVTFSGETLVDRNLAALGTTINANFRSVLTFKSGTTKISRNEGWNGGGIALRQGSSIIIDASGNATSLVITENRACNYGGGIYIEDYFIQVRQGYSYKVVIPCWLQIKSLGLFPILNISGNTALIAGNEVFGGWLKYCHHNKDDDVTVLYDPDTYVSNASNQYLSSTPTRICFCENSTPNCSIENKIVRVIPGQAFDVYAVVVGQGLGPVPAVLQARQNGNFIVQENEKFQPLGKSCTKMIFTAHLQEYPNELTSGIVWMSVGINPLLAQVILRHPDQQLVKDAALILLPLPCTKGYLLNMKTGACECNQALIRRGIECQLQNGTVQRNRKWINATVFHRDSLTAPGVLIHYFCPLDYCKGDFDYINLEQPDDQCQYNRSGVLCGRCKQNTSTVFGTSKCIQCSNYWAFLIIPLVLAAGIALVIFLMILNLTVSIGTINGLIFYANIVRANHSVFFPPGANSFLSWFIAWLNLDIGFQVCFYTDMDTFAKTWLQFVFPLYVWLMVIFMIICSHYSTKASKVTGNNAVQVLATLFLLSYTKLLRITIVSLSFTTLEYPNGYIDKVWVYDGNVQYMRGKHIVLFMAALAVLIFLSIPYTLLLISTQWLQRYSHLRALRWVIKFKPIFDAYTGPYKTKHRYWTGLLLLVRVLLFIAFSLNMAGDPTTNLLAIFITVLCLLMYSAYLGGVYRKWSLDLLENSFHLNLGILSSSSLYVYATNKTQSPLVLVSTGIAFSMFLLIIAYHAFIKLSKSAVYQKLKNRQVKEECEDELEVEVTPRNKPTTSVVELREPLIDEDSN